MEHPLVAVIPETTAQELWENEHAGIAAATSGSNWRIYWNGPTREDDIARQIALVEHAYAIGASGLVLAPDHQLALTTEVRRIIEKGIPTVILGTGLQLEPQLNLGFVLNDDQAAGILAATEIAALVHGKGDVALLGTNPDVSSSEARGVAFARALTARYPNVHLVAQPQGSYSLGQSEQDAEQVLAAHPGLKAIASIGITETRAASIAIRSAGRFRQVMLVGFDQDLDLLYALRQGAIQAIIAQDTFDMGEEAMRLIEDAHRGNSIAVTYRVAPILITRETINSQSVQRVLTMDWKPQ